MVKLLAHLRILLRGPGRRGENIQITNSLEPNPVNHQTAEIVKEDDRIPQCLERLQRLEMIVSEISNKPAEIPMEKEQMILESLERIKSVELDLERTKKVSHVSCHHYSLGCRAMCFFFFSFSNV